MTFKRKALSALSRTELLEVGRALELDVTTNMRLDDLMDVVAGSKKRGMMEKILLMLQRDTLKAMCEAVGISQEGREKQVLIDRILAAGGEGEHDHDKADKTPSPVALRVPAAKPDGAHRAAESAESAGDDEPAEPAPFSLTNPEPKAPRPAKAPAAKPRVKFTTGAKSADGTQVLSYRHADRRKNNPEVGMVDPETDPDQPKTTWAYDPHIDPALQFDVWRAGIERFIDDALASGDEATLRGALEELRRLSQPYLNWTGKAERGSFEVDTVSLHVHERIDPASILGAVRKRMKGEGKDDSGKAGSLMMQMGLFSAAFENLPPCCPKICRRGSCGLPVIEVEKPAEARAAGDLAVCPVVIRRTDVPDQLATDALVKPLGHVVLDEFLDQVA
jgi:hypothetical protein